MSRPKVLFIITSHEDLGNTGKKTGWYLPEVAHPYNIIIKQFDITVASPLGGKTPVDPGSIEAFKNDPESQAFLADEVAQRAVNESIPLSAINPADYVAVVYPGGHGPVFDLATDTTSTAIARDVYEKGGVVAAVCHGPAALVNVKLSNGEYLISGKRVTGFSNTEEEAVQLTEVVPFLLEDVLKANGGIFEKAENWGAKVVIDGKLVTGQNPASASPLGDAVVQLLSQ